jgi:hypothetical protein
VVPPNPVVARTQVRPLNWPTWPFNAYHPTGHKCVRWRCFHSHRSHPPKSASLLRRQSPSASSRGLAQPGRLGGRPSFPTATTVGLIAATSAKAPLYSGGTPFRWQSLSGSSQRRLASGADPECAASRRAAAVGPIAVRRTPPPRTCYTASRRQPLSGSSQRRPHRGRPESSLRSPTVTAVGLIAA